MQPHQLGSLGSKESTSPTQFPLREAWLRLRGPPMGSGVGPASRTHRPEPAYIRGGLPASPAPEAWALSGSAGAAASANAFPDVLSSS